MQAGISGFRCLDPDHAPVGAATEQREPGRQLDDAEDQGDPTPGVERAEHVVRARGGVEVRVVDRSDAVDDVEHPRDRQQDRGKQDTTGTSHVEAPFGLAAATGPKLVRSGEGFDSDLSNPPNLSAGSSLLLRVKAEVGQGRAGNSRGMKGRDWALTSHQGVSDAERRGDFPVRLAAETQKGPGRWCPLSASALPLHSLHYLFDAIPVAREWVDAAGTAALRSIATANPCTRQGFSSSSDVIASSASSGAAQVALKERRYALGSDRLREPTRRWVS